METSIHIDDLDIGYTRKTRTPGWGLMRKNGMLFLQGHCWGDAFPSAGLKVDYDRRLKGENEIKQNLLVGAFSTRLYSYNFGVLVPFVNNQLSEQDALFGNDRSSAYISAVRNHVSLMAYNPDHSIHYPYHAPVSSIITIKNLKPGQFFESSTYDLVNLKSLDEEYTKQQRPAWVYVEEQGYKPLNWKQFLIIAVNQIIQENWNAYVQKVPEKFNEFAISEAVPINQEDSTLNNGFIMTAL